MTDYSELVKVLKRLANGIWKNCEYTWFCGEEKVFADAADAIDALQAQLPKRGEWIKHPEVKNIYGGEYIECPFCGEKYVVQYIADEKFCRNCGADMRAKMEVQDGQA